jgi:oligopeptide/dipeptide ABC transporter ATP-binding protein
MVEPLLDIKDLDVRFSTSEGETRAIRGINLSLNPREVLGIVGESGSGKSVTALAVMGLLAKNANVTGSIHMGDRELLGMKDRQLSSIRGLKIGMIFQDPLTSLNPVYSVGWQVEEAISAHQDLSKEKRRAEAIRLLELVGIPRADDRVDDYPHEFSGGMRQRVVIAIAMANNPQIILADEPTTALDVTVQAQVLEALQVAIDQSHASLVLITHDLGVVAGLASRVVVMYAGRIVEIGTADAIFYSPAMPYTHGLLGSIPRVDDDGGARLRQIPGSPPSMIGTQPGCPFAPRCPLRKDICLTEEPALRSVSSTTGTEAHQAACHFASDVVTMPLASMFPDTSDDHEEPPQ